MSYDTGVTGSGILTSPVNISTLTIAANSNRLLAVSLATRAAAASGLTWNGVALTKAVSGHNLTTDAYAEIWYLVAPATGNQTLAITAAGAGYIIVRLHSLYDIDQSSPIDDFDSTTYDSAASVSLSGLISTQSGDDIVDCLTETTDTGVTMTAASGRVQRVNQNIDPGSYNDTFASSTIIGQASAGSTALQWTGTNFGALAAVAFKSSGGAAAPQSAFGIALAKFFASQRSGTRRRRGRRM